MKRVLLGHVVKAHGIKGALRVRPHSGDAQSTARSLLTAGELFLDEDRWRITRARPDKDELIIELDGVGDRNLAEALRGRGVFVDRDHLPAPSDDEVYLDDLVGCEVVDTHGRALGRVRGSFHNGAHEILMVDSARGERLLPYVPAMVVELDLAARRLVYDPPPGLLDLDEAEPG